MRDSDKVIELCTDLISTVRANPESVSGEDIQQLRAIGGEGLFSPELFSRLEKAYAEITYVLGLLGYNTEFESENFADTPYRCAKAFKEMIWPKKRVISAVSNEINRIFPSNGKNLMQTMEGHNVVWSLCPHHLLPVAYLVYAGYVTKPDGGVIGLSKLPRIAKYLAHMPMLQEDFTFEFANILCAEENESAIFKDALDSEGCMVIVRGAHGCMMCRGLNSLDSRAGTQECRGVFFECEDTRTEFLLRVLDKKDVF